MNRAEYYALIINDVLVNREKVVKEPVVFSHWAGPGFLDANAYALAVDLYSIKAPQRKLHSPDVIAAISTMLEGRKVGWVNSRGFAYIIKESLVDKLAPPVKLLEEMAAVDCAFVSGGRNVGKTTLLRHVVKLRRDRRVIVFDPKPAGENDWLHAEVYGLGANWNEIGDRLDQLEEQINTRSKRGEYEPLLIIADECYRTRRYVMNYVERLIDIALFARTLGVDVIFANHGTGVKANDLEGLSDLLDSFAHIHLEKLRAGQIKATIDYGDGPLNAEHPGPFGDEPPADPLASLTIIDEMIVKVALKHCGGFCSLDEVIKAGQEALPARYHGELTRHKLNSRFQAWEEAGLLLPASRDGAGRLVGRQVTPLLAGRVGEVLEGQITR
ncbi:MAG TPA: hypothetical protein VGD99_04475 [Anaerolineae bacterium]